MKFPIAIVLFALVLCSCHQKIESESKEDQAISQKVSTTPLQTVEQNYSEASRKLIKTADYRFRVKNLNNSISSIDAAVKKFPAHISNSSLTSQGNLLESVMTIRVESIYFHDLLKEIDKEAQFVHYRNIRTEDVGKQFVDLESRLKTKRQVQQRYEEILRTKAGTIEELLSAEKQIGQLEEEIEATISRLNYLKDQVSYSTINLQLYEKQTEYASADDDNDDAILSKFGNAFWDGLEGAIDVMIALTHVWPMLLIISTLTLFIYKRKKGVSFISKT